MPEGSGLTRLTGLLPKSLPWQPVGGGGYDGGGLWCRANSVLSAAQSSKLKLLIWAKWKETVSSRKVKVSS